MNTIRAVDIEGAFRGAFGYDRHLRGFVTGLHRRGIAIRLYQATRSKEVAIPDSWQDPFFESLTRPVGARVLLQSAMPHRTFDSPGQAVVNLTTFEATGIPKRWVQISREHALTVVNTEVARRAWVGSGAPPERMRVCPLGVDTEAFSPTVEPRRLRLSDGRWVEGFRTRFLNVSAIGERKNLIGLLRCWLLATSPDDDAVLILKVTMVSYGIYAWHLREVEAMQQEIGRRFEDAAPVHIIYRIYPDDEVPRLYAAATHYLSLSRGEGWDMPMTEAAAAGLRLIAPDHSAYQTYLDQTTARMIPSVEVPATFPHYLGVARLFAGLNWWQPNEEDAIAAIREAIDGRDAPLASARERMKREFTWDHATTRMIAILTEAEVMAPAPRWWPTLQGYIGRTEARWRSRRVATGAHRSQ